MAIVKEYFNQQIEMRGPGNPNAKPWVTNTTYILRFDDGQKLSTPKLAALFNAAAQDYPSLPPSAIRTFADHIEFSIEPQDAKPKADYKQLPPKTVGARG